MKKVFFCLIIVSSSAEARRANRKNAAVRVEVSTAKKRSKMVEHLIPKYEKIITAPLPNLYTTILKSAKKILITQKENTLTKIRLRNE